MELGVIFIAAVFVFHLAITVSNSMPDALPRLDHAVFGILVSALVIGILLCARRYFKYEPQSSGVYEVRNLRAGMFGMLLFFIPASIALACAVASGVVTISINGLGPEILLSLVSVALLVFISEALPEELIFRGYLYKRLSDISKNLWFVIGVQAIGFLIFAFLIGAVQSFLDASFLVTFAVILGMCRALFQTVWAAIGFHFACMTLQQSFSSGWNIFTVENGFVLQIYVLGMIPLTCAAAYLCIRLSNKNHLKEERVARKNDH